MAEVKPQALNRMDCNAESKAWDLSSAERQPATQPEIYSEQAVWLCENRKTRFKTRIQGTLAQILKQYPQDYRLKLLAIKGGRHDRSVAAD